ncbi:MAG: sigma-54 dependent transcriptional regulator [Holosporales bacterium]|nr:sigma-54 dependent transcriptional regulator [Holosporales bacterium]
MNETVPVDVLVIDDETDICELVSAILIDEGYEARFVTNGVTALESIKERQPGIVILDVWLGDGSREGLKILETIKRDHSYVPVIMMSGHSTVETAVATIKMGAYDFIEKPFQADRLLLVVKRALDAAKLKRENSELKMQVPFLCSLIGNSHQINEVKQKIDAVAQTNTKVCIHGPVGCDRAAIARYIHNLSLRTELPFCSINCLTAPMQHIETEIFGLETTSTEKNIPRKIGLLENANNGTLFIDEVHSLVPSIQARLAKFLHQSEFFRIGGSTAVKVDVRLIVGSSKTDSELLKSETFSKDLYYRTHVVSISIPPLVDRLNDIALLSRQFLIAYASAQHLQVKNLSSGALSILESYQWPGDIQQLKNVLEGSLIISASNGSNCIEVNDLPPEVFQKNQFAQSWNKRNAAIVSLPIKEARDEFEREYLSAQLKRFNGNISQTAKFIGMDRAALHRKLKNLLLKTDDTDEVD